MTDEAPKTNDLKRDTRFKPGNPGGGRPRGSRHKALIALEAIGTEAAADVIAKAIELAKAGDVQAIRIVADRVWPVRKGQRITFDLPMLDGPGALSFAIGAVVEQVSAGDLSPEEGSAVVGLIEAKRKAWETEDLAARLEALEKRTAR